MDDLINRLQARKVFNGNTTIRRDGPGCPWVEERQTVTDPLCAEAAAALTEAQATIARLEARLADVASAAARLDDTRVDQMRRLCDFAVAFAAEVADTYPAAAKSFCEGLAALSPGTGE